MFSKRIADPGKVAHVLDLQNRLRDAVARVFDLPDTTRCLKVSLEMGELPPEIEDFREHHFKEILNALPDFGYGPNGKPVISYHIRCTPTMRRYRLHHLNFQIADNGTIEVYVAADFKPNHASYAQPEQLPVNKIHAELMPEGWPNSAFPQTNEP